MRSELPSSEYLSECLEYFPETGELRWKARPYHHHHIEGEIKRFNSNYAGNEAGRIKHDGYRELRLDGKYYSVHRIIYKMVTGEDPVALVDHINGDKSDNRWVNLRDASHTQNNHNRRVGRNNTTGYKGVSKLKDGRYKVSIRVGNNKRLHLGYFLDLNEAAKAYANAAQKHHGEFSCV